MPELCSWLAAAISAIRSLTFFTEATISSMVLPASPTSRVPASTLPTESAMRALISLAAPALRCARLRTSAATTAKPRPCSPARAASTAAFSARMLVWKAMPSITPMMSEIFLDASAMPVMVLTTWPTTWPPRRATSEAPTASWLAWRAVSAFWDTVEVSSSMELAVSSRVLACSSVRCDRSRLPWAICALVSATAYRRRPATWPTSSRRLTSILASACSSWPVSSVVATLISPVRSPLAMRSAARMATFSGRTMTRLITSAMPTAAATAATTITASQPSAVRKAAEALS